MSTFTESDSLLHMALHTLRSTEFIMPEARADLAGKVESLLANRAAQTVCDNMEGELRP